MIALLIALSGATELLAGPWLQQPTPTSVIVVWETDDGSTAEVAFGPSEALGHSASGSVQASSAGTVIHSVELRDLPVSSEVFYQVQLQDSAQDVFRTTLPVADGPLTFVAMSDMQNDSNRPTQFATVVNDGVLPTVSEPIHGLLIAGDLVENGEEHSDWTDEFFAQGTGLLTRAPLFPVLGNHELNSPLYYDYMVLPGAGTGDEAEAYWTWDMGRVRLIGLDSNVPGRYAEQMTWLQGLLDASCDADIDFVVAQLHHPHHSELWTPGNNPWTGTVADALGAFSTACGIPSVHLFGHTHGYSRGALVDHNHTMINVASGGGALDRWGEQPQRDYPEYAVSTDDYGFVVMDVQAGDDPTLSFVRYSMGTPEEPVTSAVSDAVVVRKNNTGPAQPNVSGGLASADCFTLQGSAFSDADGDEHLASQWQVDTRCDDWTDPLVDHYELASDRFFHVDLQQDLTSHPVPHLQESRSLCWRVRYRDEGLAWSEWSAPAEVQLGAFTTTGELLDEEEMDLDQVGSGQCGLAAPAEGPYAIGLGVCDNTAGRSVVRRFGLSPYAERIDARELVVHRSAWFLAGEQGGVVDQSQLSVRLYDADGVLLSEPDPLTSEATSWTFASDQVPVPVGTRYVEVELARLGNTLGASFLDAPSVIVGPLGELDCPVPARPIDPDEVADCACQSSQPGAFGGLGLLLLGLVSRRRRVSARG